MQAWSLCAIEPEGLKVRENVAIIGNSIVLAHS